MKKFFLCFLVGVTVLLCVQSSDACIQTGIPTYYMGPTALGSGDGSSWANRAYLRDYDFWDDVQAELASSPVQVLFASGTYAEFLGLIRMGDPVNRLYLNANTRGGVVFSASVPYYIKLEGTRNIEIDGFKFTGAATSWGIVCFPDFRRPARDIQIHFCEFEDMTSAYYGAIGLLDGTRDVVVRYCDFDNVGLDGSAHMIYNSHDVQKVSISKCDFIDCAGDYVRFRDDTEYNKVYDCYFHSLSTSPERPFIFIPLFNDVDPGDEFHGTNFAIHDNVFDYDSTENNHCAILFHCAGFEPEGHYYALTPYQASLLGGPNGNGGLDWKREFLEDNMGILASCIRVYDNTYYNPTMQVAYRYDAKPEWDAPDRGWEGYCDITGVPWGFGDIYSPPKINNGGFEARGLHSRRWFCSGSEGHIYWHPGLEGSNAARLTNSDNQVLYNWIHYPQSTWQMDCRFIVGDNFDTTGVVFSVDIFHDEIRNKRVTVAVDDEGNVGMMNGSTFVPIAALGTIDFAVDNNANNYYNNAGDVMKWYHLRVVGDYSGGTPHTDIYLGNANTMTLSRSATSQTYFVNGCYTGAKADCVGFNNFESPVVIDDVTWQ